MDLIKLLDVSSPKNIKNAINTLIAEYENVAENFPTKLSDLTDDETHRLVTDTEKASWNKKQNAIDDLSTIRSGASLGATAVQPNSLGTLASKNIVDYNTEVTNKPTIPSIEGLASETFVNTKAQEVLTTANKHTDDRISGLIGQAPETLDTLKEIADALAEDQTALDTLNLAIGNKVNKTLKINGKTLEQDVNLTAADVGALSSFTETDPTVPAWAKAPTKPSYNYSEINNTPTIPIVNNSTITIKQGEETKGTFTLNQSNASTIELDVGGSNVTLYGSTGQNTDGAMTQKATTDELNKKTNLDASNLSQTNVEAWIEKLGVTGLPIGSMIVSTCVQHNAGLHLADGSELAIGGSYDAFCQYVINNQADFEITDLATYQSELAEFGQCGKYVITDTYVKLPKITKMTESANSRDELGKNVKAGLPDIRGEINIPNGNNTTGSTYFAAGGALTNTGNASRTGNASGAGVGGRIVFMASLYNPIYGSSHTVQPQTVKYYYYIVISNVTKTDIEVNIDNIATDLNNKADKDAANINDTNVVNWRNKLGVSNFGEYDNLWNGNTNGTYTIPDISNYKMLLGAVKCEDSCWVSSYIPVEFLKGEINGGYNPNWNINGNNPDTYMYCIFTFNSTTNLGVAKNRTQYVYLFGIK